MKQQFSSIMMVIPAAQLLQQMITALLAGSVNTFTASTDT
jgi:hypothetical protein